GGSFSADQDREEQGMGEEGEVDAALRELEEVTELQMQQLCSGHSMDPFELSLIQNLHSRETLRVLRRLFGLTSAPGCAWGEDPAQGSSKLACPVCRQHTARGSEFLVPDFRSLTRRVLGQCSKDRQRQQQQQHCQHHDPPQREQTCSSSLEDEGDDEGDGVAPAVLIRKPHQKKQPSEPHELLKLLLFDEVLCLQTSPLLFHDALHMAGKFLRSKLAHGHAQQKEQEQDALRLLFRHRSVMRTVVDTH
ncbi:unnamed protein product, partial [Amoebophrya sp. A25]